MVNTGALSGTLSGHGSVSGSLTGRSSVFGGIRGGTGGGEFGGRIITKTTAEWNETPTRMSVKNTIYVYSDYRSVEDPETHEVTYIPRLKCGDGTTYIVDLPFSTMSITQNDIDAWNNKSTLEVTADEETETLIFTE